MNLEAGIEIVLNLDDNIKINGYENELIQCFINIFNNAKDALAQNNIEQKYIFLSTSQDNDNIIIKIKDNAGGIPEDILPRVFEPYFTTKHQSNGTGLGLHMSYNLIVEGVNGSMYADNVTYLYNAQEYKGAELTITIPLQ